MRYHVQFIDGETLDIGANEDLVGDGVVTFLTDDNNNIMIPLHNIRMITVVEE